MTPDKGSALLKGLTILEALAASPDGLTAQELASLLSIHRTNIYRYLRTLEQARYVRRHEHARFRLGSRVLELGAHHLQRMPLREAAHQHLRRLSHTTERTIHLSVLEESDLLYIDKIEGPQTLPMRSRIGTRVPAHCTASGKILLALLPAEERKRVLDSATLEQRTSATITDRAQLEEELERSADRGYAIDHGESEEHICCFAAPIFDQSGNAVAAVSLTGLSSDVLDPDEHSRLRQEVLDTAARISADRGFAVAVEEGA
jgi:IclR family acetate operon transcriptional repressor